VVSSKILAEKIINILVYYNDAIHYALEGYEGCSEFHTYEGLKK
jgi:hypothetical protein